MSYIIFWAAERESRRRSVKEIFLKEGATNPENAIELGDMSTTQRSTLERLIRERVIFAVNGKYYFDVAGEEDLLRRAKRHNWVVALWLTLLVIVLFIVLKNS